jgi:hypothetical protein
MMESGSFTRKGSSLIFTGTLNEDDWYQMHRYSHRLRIPLRNRWIAGIIFTIAAVAVEYTAALYKNDYTALVTVPIYAALMWNCVFPVGTKWKLARSYRKHSDNFVETTVTLSDTGVQTSNALANHSFVWPLIGCVLQVPEGLMFMNKAGGVFFWLPIRILQDHVIDDVTQLLARNNVRIRRL